MAKTKEKKPIYLRRLRNYTPQAIDSVLGKMRYIDLQRACLIRGIGFEELVEGDFYRLQSWLAKNWDTDLDTGLLDKFDEWRERVMKSQGKDEPFIRLGYVAEKDEETGEVTKVKKIRNLKKPKRKRERNKSLGNIFKGTKKELALQCEKEGKSLDQTIKIVMEKFPDALEKSVRIWYKKAKRERAE